MFVKVMPETLLVFFGHGVHTHIHDLPVLACRSANDFKCRNNLCLPRVAMCDGTDHCGDGSDEAELCGASVEHYIVLL